MPSESVCLSQLNEYKYVKGRIMFYIYLRNFVAFLLWMLNGNAHYHNKDKILDPSENYILVAPHRTWWDPVYMAFATKPKEFIFMAKKELFKNAFCLVVKFP